MEPETSPLLPLTRTPRDFLLRPHACPRFYSSTSPLLLDRPSTAELPPHLYSSTSPPPPTFYRHLPTFLRQPSTTFRPRPSALDLPLLHLLPPPFSSTDLPPLNYTAPQLCRLLTSLLIRLTIRPGVGSYAASDLHLQLSPSRLPDNFHPLRASSLSPTKGDITSRLTTSTFLVSFTTDTLAESTLSTPGHLDLLDSVIVITR
ncbi:uncharacterized protein K452DRAFT_127178 [Aplosporella prunicola CBS 121167]|uniref:Uncharacterized protein n=1 Tax=Aplosporella prunicola CBS 121167 TaxID=1176127 RepID=A0A6A6AY08_9PEZI|nr:uncharacterized protein K452DRAFT_127178 [Aplosporella prunicola CBS 121167]KAF2136670.1 hypothetical protein K452DRAFT_127178 [Aplosporella prunicola CBS 121167]